MSEAETLLNKPARAAETKGRSGLYRLLPFGIILAGLALSYAFGLQHYLSLTYLGESRAALKAYVAANYLLSAALFMSIYITAVAFSLPAATILTVFGGFLFGWLAAQHPAVSRRGRRLPRSRPSPCNSFRVRRSP